MRRNKGSVRGSLSLVLALCTVFPLVAQEWVGTRPRVLPWSREGEADRVRLGVRKEGLQVVTADEVATAMGISSSVVSNDFQTTNFIVSCRGQTVACSVADGQLIFRGESAFTQRVPENVYWFQRGAGLSSPPWVPDPAPTNGWVFGTTTVQGTNVASYFSMGTLTNLPSFLAFSRLSVGNIFAVTNTWSDGVTNPVPGTLSISVLSAANEGAPDEHSVSISVNGTFIGSTNWSEEAYQTYTYPVPGELLTTGVAVIQVSNNTSVAGARFFWTKYALTVARRSDLQPPVFRPSLRGVRDADGMAADDVADYVVLIPPEGWVTGFREALQPLVTRRTQQGLRTAVLDVEALYNRFTDGLARPEAIQAFCANAYRQPHVKLRYLLLAGSGSLDFAHERYAVTDYQSCLLPPLIAGQTVPFSSTPVATIIARDMAFGDVEGDAAPEIAVGRFPTARTQELAVAVSKTLAYETAEPWKAKAALTAGTGSTFMQDMDAVSVPLQAAGKTTTNCYSANPTTWTTKLKPAFQSGVGTFWYIGHSAETYMGNTPTEKLFEISTLKTTAWTNAPVAILMGCQLNRWQGMNTTTTNDEALSFGPFSLFRTGTGFSAVVACTGYAMDGNTGASGEAQMLAYYLATCSGSNGIYRIGDALCSALRQLALYDPPINADLRPYYDPPPITPDNLQSYSLVGDPALMWRHDYTATGIPVSWLLSQGLTVGESEVSDTDGDGWLDRQEYQAGTDPGTNKLQIAMQSLTTERGRLGVSFETKANSRYRVLWKPSLEGADPWTPSTWAWPGETGDPRPASEWILPPAPVSQIEIPLRPEYSQGFYKIEQEDY